ncbi:MAG: hypothetical protein DCC71_09705, partial [Proteobacteria bacterium]
LLGGLWELPGGEVHAARRGAASVAELLRARTGLAVASVARAGDVEHLFTHRTLRLRVFRCEAVGGRLRLDGWQRHRWLAPARFEGIPCGNATKKALALFQEQAR